MSSSSTAIVYCVFSGHLPSSMNVETFSMVLVGDAEDLDALILVLLLQFAQVGHAVPAGRAPGRPEFDDVDGVLLELVGEFALDDLLQLGLGCLVADRELGDIRGGGARSTGGDRAVLGVRGGRKCGDCRESRESKHEDPPSVDLADSERVMVPRSGARCPASLHPRRTGPGILPSMEPGKVSSAAIIDGKALAKKVRRAIAERIAGSNLDVRLDAVLVGSDRAAEIYARNQLRTCVEVGISYALHRVPDGAGFDEIADQIVRLNSDDDVSAIMLHLPLPDAVDTDRIQTIIDPVKDVEGVNPANIGNVVYGRRSLVPCTALATLEMIESTGITLRGAHCVVIGASNIVGKPVAILLMRAEASVVSTNKHTKDLAAHTFKADVLVSAAGVPGLVTADMVKPGAVVIDVGINRIANADGSMRTVGDIDFDGVLEVAGAISPVPGGVGPMTVAMLLRNTVEAAIE